MRRVLRSIISNYVVVAVQAASLLLLAPLLISHLGIGTFGRWSVIAVIVGYLQLTDLGLVTATARSVAASKSADQLNMGVNATIGLLCLVTVLLLLGSIAVALTAPAPSISHSFHLALAVAVAIFALRLPLTVAEAVLYGLERIVERNLFVTASAAASLLVSATCVLAGGGLVDVVLSGAVAQLLVSLALVIYVVTTVEGMRLSPRSTSLSQLRSMVSVTSGIFGLNLAAQIILYSDTLVVGVLYGAVSTGIYAVGMRAVQGATLLLNQISDVFFPGFARGHARGDREAFVRISVAVTVTVCIAFAMIGTLVAFGDRLIQIWVGTGFHGAWVPMLLLSTSLALNGPLRYAILWAIAANEHGKLIRVAAAEATANLLLSIGLGIAFGLVGVAAASSVTFLVSNGLVMPRLLYPMLELNWRSFVQPIAFAAALVLPASALLHAVLAGSHLAAGLVLVASVLWAGVIFLSLAPMVVGRAQIGELVHSLSAARTA